MLNVLRRSWLLPGASTRLTRTGKAGANLLRRASFWLAAGLVFAGGGAAKGATVVNGGFESGTMTGWSVQSYPASTGWFIYSGTHLPLGPWSIPSPSEGQYAVTSDSGIYAAWMRLYQDIPLEPGYSHQLSFSLAYELHADSRGFSDSSLSLTDFSQYNEQVRVEVLSPSGSTLATIYQTNHGDAFNLSPTPVTYDLSPFAGQTIRLQFGVMQDHYGLYAQVDNVRIVSTSLDTVAPVTTASGNSNADASGSWTNQNVNVVLNATDTGGSGTKEITYSASGAQPIDETTVNGATASFTISAEGTTTISFHAKDNADNVEQPDNTFVVNIDKTAPSLSVPTSPVAATATSINGAYATFSASAFDSTSGLATLVSTPASGSLFPLGLSTVSTTATDNAGNSMTGNFTVNVTYAWSSFLQPINSDNSSVFKLGSTIPVKFQLTGESAGITNATAVLKYAQVSNGVAGDVNEATSTTTGTTGTLFRYDATSNTYLFNWSTKGLTTGIYELQVDLGDGVMRSVRVGLK